MKAVLYKSLTNKQDEIELKENTPLYMQLPDIDFENAIIIVNGSERNKDYCPKKTDIIMIRQTPSDPVTIIVGVVGAVSLGVGVYSGVKAYQANKQAEQAMAESERAMENAKKASANPSIDNRPFIAGATNTVATGQGQPYVMGRHLFTPYLLQKGFYKLGGVDGKDQYYYMAFECGFNKQVINSVNVDEVRVKTFTGQTPQDGVFDLDSGIFEDGGRLEIRQGGQFQELTDLNKKIVAQSYSSEIPKRTEVNQEYNEIVLDRHAKDVEIGVTYPYGLYAYNDNNDKVARSSSVRAQLSFDGGNNWESPVTIVDTGNRNELTELRFSNTIPFTSAQITQSKTNNTSPIVRLYDNQTESEKARDKVFLLFAQSVCYDPNSPTFEDCKIINQKELELSTVMALKIKSSQANEDKLNKINIITQSIAKTWNGSQWSEAKEPTRNPASIAIEVLTSTAHEQSRYDLDEIDSESFGEWYEYCVLNNYHFDYILNQKVSKESLIDRILKAGDASLYVDIYGKLAVAIDTFKPNAIACFNAQNIIEIENKKSFTRAIDGVRVNYTSSANNAFSEDSVLVMRDGKEYNADSVLQEIKLEGVTEYNHVVKYIRRLIATLNLRPKTTLISVGQEGVYYTPYSKILLQDDSLKIGLSSGVVSKIFVQGDKIAYIETNDLVQFEVGKQYGIIVNHLLEDRAVPVAIRVSGTGRTGEIEILDDITQGEIEAGEVFSFGELNESGEFDRITSPFLITAVSRVGNKFKIDLVDYNEAVYETGEIPAYESNITEPYKPTPAPIPPDYVTRPELDDAVQQGGSQPIGVPDTPSITAVAGEDRITLKCDPFLDEMRNNIRVITWQVNKDFDVQSPDTGWEEVSVGSEFETSYLFNRSEDGYPEKADLQNWRFRAKTESVYSKTSEWSTSTLVNTDAYGTWLLTLPTANKSPLHRSLNLALGLSPNSGGLEVYGNIQYQIQIRKNGVDAEDEFFKPATDLDPYASENNYKDGDGFVLSSGTYTQTVPLTGQTDGSPENTSYQFKIIAQNEANVSEPILVEWTATATSITDIVDSAITTTKLDENAVTTEKIHADAVTAEKIAVEILSAISANVGTINQGAFGDGTNVWDLSSFIDEHGVQRVKGRFKVGDDNGYFRVEPVYTGTGASVIITGYNVSFKAQKMTVESDKTSFEDEIDIYLSTNNATKILIAPQNIKFYDNGTLKATIDEGWVNDRKINQFTHYNQFTTETHFDDINDLISKMPYHSVLFMSNADFEDGDGLTELMPYSSGFLNIQTIAKWRTQLTFSRSDAFYIWFGISYSNSNESHKFWSGWQQVATLDDDLISTNATWSSDNLQKNFFKSSLVRVPDTEFINNRNILYGCYPTRLSQEVLTELGLPQIADNDWSITVVGDSDRVVNAYHNLHYFCVHETTGRIFVVLGDYRPNETDFRVLRTRELGLINDTDLDSTNTVLSAGKVTEMNTFSDDEVDTGKTWFGEPVYRFCCETTGPFATGDSVFSKSVGGEFCPRPQIVSMSCVQYKGDPFFSFTENADGFYIKTEMGNSVSGGVIHIFTNEQIVVGKQRFVIEYIYKN